MANYNAIEWNILLQHLSDCAQTAMGKLNCLNLDLSSNLEQISQNLNILEDAYIIIQRKEDIDIRLLMDIGDLFNKVIPKYNLSINEIFMLKTILVLTGEVKPKLLGEIDKCHNTFQLQTIVSKLALNNKIIDEIERIFDIDQEFKIDCTINHYNLVTNLLMQENKLKEEINNIIHDPKLSTALQEPIYTKRNDRYVIPVKTSHKNEIRGIIHDRSASGLTYYIEPFTVVNLANTIQNIKNDIANEQNKIIRKLSQIILGDLESIKINYQTLVELDTIFAKARFAHLYNGIKPNIVQNNTLKLIGLKHPLLVLKNTNVVSSDVELADNNNTLIITGPNAGGKTILLKSIGLACLMVKASMFIASKQNSIINIYHYINMALGDNQSVEADLSTFSSHLKNIINMYNMVNSNTLILIDEIASGTNPQEGVALAKAFIEAFHLSSSTNIFTTHYEELITLKQKFPGIKYGGFEYDNQILCSTYKFTEGLTSSSKALELAKRLNLSDQILNNAYKIYKEEFNIAYNINLLKDKEFELTNREQIINTKEKVIEENYSQIEKIKLSQLDQLNQEFNELKTMLNKDYSIALNQINELIKELQKEKTSNFANYSKDKAKQIINDFNNSLVDNSNIEHHHISDTNNEIKIGSLVRIKSLNQTGEVIKINNLTNNRREIILKTSKFQVKSQLNDLELLKYIPQAKPKLQIKKNLQRVISDKQTQQIFTSFNTLNLIGKRVPEAIPLLEEFLDKCYLNNLNCVLIIHGIGQGILKRAIHDYLAQSEYISDYNLGQMNQGGDGVTIAYLP